MEEFKSKLWSKENDMLFDTILLLENREDCYRFFEDICTVAELKSIAQRLEAARLLREGVTYHDISERLGASTATISRVNRSLAYGAEGYTRLLDRLEVRNKTK